MPLLPKLNRHQLIQSRSGLSTTRSNKYTAENEENRYPLLAAEVRK